LVDVVWSNLAPFHCVVVWQTAQSLGNAAATWFGLAVRLKSARWHPSQVEAVPANLPATWHEEHWAVECAPVNGNLVFPWSNWAPFHCVVVWQIVQSFENPAATWFGFAAPLKSLMWQPSQVDGVPWKTLFL